MGGGGNLGKPTLVLNVPFKSSTWTLTSGIPATTRALDYSFTTNSLVRKTAMVSQVGRAKASDFTVIHVFMSNDPSSPTHWLSQIRLDLQGNTSRAGVHQSQEAAMEYSLKQKCDYQVGCANSLSRSLLHSTQYPYTARFCMKLGTLHLWQRMRHAVHILPKSRLYLWPSTYPM